MKYYVIIRIEETIEIDDATNEADAIKEALQQFDPTAHDAELVAIWDDKDD